MRRDRVLHRADGKACIGEIDIFAPQPKTATELSGAAGVLDQLEARQPRRELALDDLHRRDLGIALVAGDAGIAVFRRPRAGAAGEDLVLHIALAGIGRAAADDDRTAAAAVGAR